MKICTLINCLSWETSETSKTFEKFWSLTKKLGKTSKNDGRRLPPLDFRLGGMDLGDGARLGDFSSLDALVHDFHGGLELHPDLLLHGGRASIELPAGRYRDAFLLRAAVSRAVFHIHSRFYWKFLSTNVWGIRDIWFLFDNFTIWFTSWLNICSVVKVLEEGNLIVDPILFSLVANW